MCDLRRYKYRILYAIIAACDLTLFAVFLVYSMGVLRTTDTTFEIIIALAIVLLIVNTVTIVLGYRHAKKKFIYTTPS